MVGLPDLFGGGRERKDGVCESWFGEGGNYAIGRFLGGCTKLGNVGSVLFELGTPGLGGLEGRHGYGVGCFLLVVDNGDNFKWVCYPRIFCLRRGVGVKLVFVANVTVIPAVPLGFSIVSVESGK